MSGENSEKVSDVAVLCRALEQYANEPCHMRMSHVHDLFEISTLSGDNFLKASDVVVLRRALEQYTNDACACG